MEAIVNSLIKATGWSIFHSLWQGAVIYGIVLMIAAAFPKLNARFKHNIAYGAMCLMLMSFCLTFSYVFKIPTSGGTIVQNLNQADVAMDQHNTAMPWAIGSRTESLFPYLVSIYTIGLLFQLLVLGVGYRKLLKLKNAQRNPVPLAWQHVFESITEKLNLSKQIGFSLSDKVNVPLVIGYLKPVLLFPVALASQMDIQQVEAILIHELSHIRRNDYLLNLIKTAIETLLFFNPFMWLCSKLINIEREHACDDLVVKLTGTPVTYAHALLQLELLKDKTAPVLSMAATGNNQHLYQRIKRITNMKTNYMNAKQQLFAIAITIATVVSLAWISPEKTINTTDKKRTDKKTLNINTANFKTTGLQRFQITSAAYGNEAIQDTTKKKKKFKIVTIDDKGNKQEYNSVKEMPDSLLKQVIEETFFNKSMGVFNLDSGVNFTYSFKAIPQDLKAFIDVSKVNAEMLKLKIGSPEFKKQIEEAKKNAEDASKNIKQHYLSIIGDNFKITEDLKKQLNSEEFKKQQEYLSNGNDAFNLYFKQFNNSELKKQAEEMKELRNSPEYKKLKKKFDEDLEKIKKKKGINTDIGTIKYSRTEPIVIKLNDGDSIRLSKQIVIAD